MRERGIRMKPRRIGMVSVVLGVAVIAGEWSFCVERSQAIQAESRTEKEANLKGQAQGGCLIGGPSTSRSLARLLPDSRCWGLARGRLRTGRSRRTLMPPRRPTFWP